MDRLLRPLHPYTPSPSPCRMAAHLYTTQRTMDTYPSCRHCSWTPWSTRAKDNVSTQKWGRKGLHHSLAHPSLAAPLQTLALPLQDGRTPLHHAAHYGHLQVVQALLLDPLVNPETKDNVSTQRG